MVYLSKQVNNLKACVEDNQLDKRTAKWKTVSEVELTDFPVLDEKQLRYLTCGTYQLKPSSSYMQEHIDVKSKKISNDQELIQSDPTSCPQNQKGNN